MSDETIADRVQHAAERAIADRVANLVFAVWDHTLGLLVNLILISRHAKDLSYWKDMLEERKKDVSITARHEARKNHAELGEQLKGWMKRVADLSKEATDFETSFKEPFCITGFCLGYEAVDLLRRAKRLYDDGNAIRRDQVINPRRPDAVKRVPCDIMGSQLLGGEAVLRRIKGHIKEDRVGIIGVHGKAGVGKTSILQIINNEYLYTEARSRFDMAIWVKVPASSVPQEVVSSIQTTIAQRLEVTLPADTPSDTLFQELCAMRFILLLDDVCGTLNLQEIGIPRPITVNNRSKILFTTSLEHVCNEMADQVEMVDVLDPVKSWDLFRKQFRNRAADFLNNPDNLKRAQEVAAGCGGVPTLLIDAGKKMAIDAVKPMARTTNNLPDEINRSGPPAAEPSEGTGRAPHS